MNKELLKTGIAVRKLREIRGLNRKEASVLLEVGHKTIESFENGRNAISKEKLAKYLALYGFTNKDFELCLDGKVSQVKSKHQPRGPKVIENNPLRRSYKKIATKESKALLVLRRLKNLTQYKASLLCGYSRTSIGHIENGRIEIPTSRIKHIVESYGYTMKDFEHHMTSEVFVTDIQDDCIKIIKGLGEEKLKAVYPLLSTFNN
ncbi:MAG: helix-turn-helix transcriptional regulator [Bdellovibrionales bacterium]|nr:helix-turn-helix transcriptional regulator [Bdellovibrionales bacterium]MBT3525019.1 helix-turn-helix transcriptional regulator [Bdellovibrionales bacterium]MBT7767616.1 helix-turn-helix transcriptional regulator [Bdellovibrionales bacterium]